MARARISAPAPSARDPHPAQGRPPAPPAARRQRRANGLAVVEHNGFWRIDGTPNARGVSGERIRQSTGLRATAENRVIAEDVRRRLEAEFIDQVVYGKKPQIAVSIALGRYLDLDDEGNREGKDLGALDSKILAKADAKFGSRPLAEISGDDWAKWIKLANRGNQPATIRRFWNPLRAFLGWCAKPERGWLAHVPSVELPEVKNERHAKRRRVGELSPELLTFLFDYAPLHLKAQLYVQWSTGARVVSILFGCRLCDLTLGRQRSAIRFHDTKNGDPVDAHLHPETALIIAEYLQQRGRLDEREGPLFLTPKGEAYSHRGRERGWGSENKTSWRGMKRRAVAARRELAAAAVGEVKTRLLAEAELLAQVTPHWLRHWFATHALSHGMPLADVMAQGGWRDQRSLQRYSHDIPEARRQAVDRLPIGGTGAGRVRHAAGDWHDLGKQVSSSGKNA